VKYAALALLFLGCASTVPEQLPGRAPSPPTAYESDQWRAAHAACGYASPCSAPEEALRAVHAVRTLWRGRYADGEVDARVDEWIERERARQ
jgi:hypothetical protein